MRILILGGNGMLGHTLLQTLGKRHDTRVTLRSPLAAYTRWSMFNAANAFDGVDIRSTHKVATVLQTFRPDAVVNCVGLVKQRDHAHDVLANLEINAVVPHHMARLCHGVGARFVQISTDCVFSGRRGNYTEEDEADACDLYGRTKHLGEVIAPHCLTIRTSIVGRELSNGLGLLEWFLAQRGPVKGYARAIFSGLTTVELANVIEKVMVQFPQINGLYHVSSDPINKYTLLHLFREHFQHLIPIARDETVVIDRSLNSSLFRKLFSYNPPSWAAMVKKL